MTNTNVCTHPHEKCTRFDNGSIYCMACAVIIKEGPLRYWKTVEERFSEDRRGRAETERTEGDDHDE